MNPGFSSTPGVHIAMSRFSEINYDPSTQTVEVGAGLVFDDVYAALEPHGVNVVGGRVNGIGIAGFTLGGGMTVTEKHKPFNDKMFSHARLLVALKRTWVGG